MSELIRLTAEEQAYRDTVEQSKTEHMRLIDFYRSLIDTSLPLMEIPILEPVAELLSSFAYSCSVGGLAKAITHRTETIQMGIFRKRERLVVHDIIAGWRIHSGQYDDGEASYPRYLYIDESDLVTMDQISPEYISENEKQCFDFTTLKKSIVSTLLDNNIKPLERPRE
jgi:nitrogen fixation-related uncharacterized protein